MALLKRFVAFILLLLAVLGCAKRGSITGGPKDETPPAFVRSFPPNFSTNFKSNEIRIYFDELISLNNPNTQVIISPPMKNKPEITPLGGARKYVKINFQDTLIPNTTYTINFGSSVEDYNEKNPLPFFQYVFSTGAVLDSLSFKGSVIDAFKKKTAKNISVFLYEKNESFNDSTIFKDVPRYVANTLDSTLFEFKNLKEGTYHIVAIQDKNSNYLFDPKQDKVAFIKDSITIPQDSIANLRLFAEEIPFKWSRAKQTSKYGFEIGYFGQLDTNDLEIKSTVVDTATYNTYYKLSKKDTLKVFSKPFVTQDSLLFILKNNSVTDTLISRYKDQFLDSLKLEHVNSKTTLALKEAIKIRANTPFNKVDKNKMKLFDKDTLPVAFSYSLDRFKNLLEIQFEKTEDNSYNLKLLPEAIEDYLTQKNDTLNFNFTTGNTADYGNLILNLSGASSPLIVQLITKKKVAYEKVVAKGISTINFNSIEPEKYEVRIILDENENGVWDTGNYLKKIQPENTFFFTDVINVRANWDVQQPILIPSSLVSTE